MLLQIFFFSAADEALQALTPADLLFNSTIKKNERHYREISKILETKNRFELMRQTGEWSRFLDEHPPFDRAMIEQMMSREIDPLVLCLHCDEDHPFGEFFPLIDRLPKEQISMVNYSEHSADFRVPDEGVYYFRNTRVDVEKMIKGAVQKVSIMSPSIDETIAAHAAVKNGQLDKDAEASHRAKIIRNAVRQSKKDLDL